MLLLCFSILGWLLARTPEPILAGLAAVVGEAIWRLAPGRRRLMLSNLGHAFPGKPRAWQVRIARASVRRMVETGLLSLATPFLSERRIRRLGRLSPAAEPFIRRYAANPRPLVLGTLHLALWESQTWLKLLSPAPLPEFGIIFRPLDNRAADAYVKRTRERFGMRLLSRRDGFAQALKILRGNGSIGVLFDQNAGDQGNLTTLFGRVCSTTELPGLLAAKFGAEVRTFYPRRTGFWRVQFECDPVEHDGTPVGITLALNRWLEAALQDEDLCASWLWAHNRWRHQDVPARRLRLESRRDLLADDLRARGWTVLPRRTRIWVRMPNWLGDVLIALPLLRALRAGRPDAEITLLVRPAYAPLLEAWGVADRLIGLPRRGPGYFRPFWKLRQEYPDVFILFTQSWRGDLEAWLTGAPQRFGLVRPGRRRPLLTDAYRVPAAFDEARHHQLELWENFLRHFGLREAPDRTPWEARPGPALTGPIGLIAGSENQPAKRWPVGHWRELIAALPGERFVLLGTANDRPITAAIAAGFSAGRVEDLAGRTDLPGFAARLRACRLLVTNDTGGMHLANGLGVPMIGLFGPTNPTRTGPIYDAPHLVLQAPGAGPAGAGDLARLAPAEVIAAIGTFSIGGASGD
jgi:ADP-heptose:LPS heptosyltransferase/lauroyl/myristoyl acyltransferase